MTKRRQASNPNQISLDDVEINTENSQPKTESQASLQESGSFDSEGYYNLLVQEGYSPEGARKLVGWAAEFHSEGHFNVQEVSLGAAIPVDSRTPAAQAIMAYFNQVNKGSGVDRSRGYSGFDDRYQEKSEDVLRGMSQKEERLYGGFLKAVDHLFSVEDLVGVGFNKDEMQQRKNRYTRALYHHFGPGNAYAPDRTKAVNKLRKADRERDKVSKQQKRTKKNR